MRIVIQEIVVRKLFMMLRDSYSEEITLAVWRPVW